MQKTERLVAITLLLQARGKMTAKRLAYILGVSTRTIYRDVEALSLAHVPVAMDYGPGGGYYLPDDYHFESAIFTREEAVSLVLSADMAGNYSLFAGDDGLHRALLKLEATLPEEYRADVRAARARILLDIPADPAERGSFLELIRSAVLEMHQLEIRYPCTTCAHPPDSHWLCIEPYGLVFKGLTRRHIRTGRWYLVACCRSCQACTTFRLNRIEDVRVCDDRFTPDSDFDLHAFWQEARTHLDEHPIEVTLHLTPAARRELNGKGVLLKEEPDGSVVVRIEVESFEAAVSYALGLGSRATVIGPSKVRKAVIDTAHAIAEQYDTL